MPNRAGLQIPELQQAKPRRVDMQDPSALTPQPEHEEVFERLNATLGHKGRKSLTRVREACNQIELARGAMDYSRVAAVAMNAFGGPKIQTIFNSRALRDYIDARAQYASGRSATPKAAITRVKSTDPHYPSSNLDAKTRTHIDLLRATVNRQKREIDLLSKATETLSAAKPISFVTAFHSGVQPEGALDLQAGMDRDKVPASLRAALPKLLSRSARRIQIEAQNDLLMLICTVDGERQVLLTPAQVHEVLSWLATTSANEGTSNKA